MSHKEGQPLPRICCSGTRHCLALRRFIDLGVARTELWFAFQCVSARRSVTMDILWDLVQKTLPFVEPPPQGFYETFVPLAAFQLCRRLCVGWQRRRDCQPEADEQRQCLDRDSDTALQPLDLPRQPIEAPGKSGLTAVCAIRGQEGFDRCLHDCRA